MGLLLDWTHLDSVALPFAASLTVASLLALPLQRAAERTGLPRLRERCLGCRAEPELIATGSCPERCAVNDGPALPLLTFVGSTTAALFALSDPADFARYVLPIARTGPGVSDLLVAFLVGTNALSAVLLAAYFVQDRRAYQETFARGAALVALAGLVAVGVPGDRVLPWFDLAVTVSLAALLLTTAIEWRARTGRPAFGLRTIGFATLPLFAVALLGAIRIVQDLALAGV